MRNMRGNILFLILLAVVLFAALAYAVTSSMRGGGKSSGTEQSKALASTIINQMALVENTVNRMLLMGVRVETLDFGSFSADTSSLGGNAGCSSDDCRVFKQVTPLAAPLKATDQTIAYSSNVMTPNREGRFFAALISVKNIGTPLGDVVVGYKALTFEVCNQINIMSGVYNEGDAMIANTESQGTVGTNVYDYQGNLDPLPSVTADRFGSSDARIAGKTTFCVPRNSGTNGYYLYHVVVAR